jgi:hypothetical protein
MSDLVDVPVELTTVDGSKWIVYYRLGAGKGYAQALEYVMGDAHSATFRPAEDLDRIQRRTTLVNMAHVVSVADPDTED